MASNASTSKSPMESVPRHSLDACYRQDSHATYARAKSSSAAGHNTIIHLNPVAVYADQSSAGVWSVRDALSGKENSLTVEPSVVKESVEVRNVRLFVLIKAH